MEKAVQLQAKSGQFDSPVLTNRSCDGRVDFCGAAENCERRREVLKLKLEVCSTTHETFLIFRVTRLYSWTYSPSGRYAVDFDYKVCTVNHSRLPAICA
ncbi:unnamed protein product [Heligmosomoides polygyrus]|uniref:MAM domain-containing protein n=1 Tax=Heligmosomoides polygyrus TaxID=6339 RepID=A0A183FCA8_HELPZ|nr:unnamed protein product [Heligmosomoides polygyrus]